MTTFSPNVPQQAQDKIQQIIEFVEENELFADCYSCEQLTEPTRSSVEWQSRDGFLSSNLGGFTLQVWLESGNGSGNFLTAKHKGYVEEQRQDCLQAFMIDYGIESEDEALEDDRLTEYETDWFDEVLLEFRCFVSEDLTVNIDLACCYKDAPYYRERYFEKIGALSLSFEQLDRLQLTIIDKFFKRAIRRA